MTAEDETVFEGSPRQFDVELFIAHPSVDPAAITHALELKASHSHRVGDRRETPKGFLLPDSYPDTRWRHSVRFDVTGQWFADKIDDLVDRLEPHRAYLADLAATGGRLTLIVQFSSGDYFGDEISQSTLARIVDLGLSLGIECYSIPQT